MQKRIYEPLAGEHIDNTIEESLKLSRKYLSPVEFSFNGITIVVNASVNNTVSFYSNEFKEKTEKRAEKYRNSREYAKELDRRELARLEAQGAMDYAMNTFVKVIRDMDVYDSLAIKWFIDFIPLSDTVGVTYDKALVIEYLYEQSVFPNMYVGYEGEWTRDKKLSWIYGQILEGLIKHGIVHPIFSYKLKELK